MVWLGMWQKIGYQWTWRIWHWAMLSHFSIEPFKGGGNNFDPRPHHRCSVVAILLLTLMVTGKLLKQIGVTRIVPKIGQGTRCVRFFFSSVSVPLFLGTFETSATLGEDPMTSTCHLTVFLTLREPFVVQVHLHSRTSSDIHAGLVQQGWAGDLLRVRHLGPWSPLGPLPTVPLVGGTEDSRPFANKVWAELRPRLLGEPGGETTSVAPQLQPKGHSGHGSFRVLPPVGQAQKVPPPGVLKHRSQGPAEPKPEPKLPRTSPGTGRALYYIQGKEHG